MTAPKPAPGRTLRGSSGTTGARALPAINHLLEGEALRSAAARHGRPLVLRLVRERLAALRTVLRADGAGGEGVRASLEALPAWVEEEARARTGSTIRPVINATGVVLHTNLGRALLSDEALRRVAEVGRSYTTLEYDLETGRRGSRSSHLDRLFGVLFPGRAAQVVNNNAAAVLLALNTLAEGREVVVSRGELVEIGGSFRIPDIMRKSGAILREVGTTNKTRLADYERAIGKSTGLILKVHPSNYRIVGFTAEVPLSEAARLAKKRRLPLLFDQGSGVLHDLAPYGVRGEPTIEQALHDGADVVAFSGDKMLGGPQAGILVGRPDLIRRMRENSLSRALRVDKLTYAALEASLLEYVRGAAAERLPAVRMVARDRGAIEARARALAERVGARAGETLTLRVEPGGSLLGAGSAPQTALPTALLAVAARGLSARAVEERLRRGEPPVIARIEEGRVLLDLRTVLEEQEPAVEAALLALAAGAGGGAQTLKRKLITSPSRTT